MILGIGCDICDIRRIEKLIETQGVKFLKRVFTTSEQERLQKRAESTAGFAKVFAAKESLVKALGNSTDISWQDIEVIKNPHGRPEFILHGAAHEMAEKLAEGPYQLKLSLSDEPPYALAYVIFCKIL
ncbi:MAG: holo-ACP synthase [Alphaproteobacteria bacterium]|jgi:holo-[acyl-carrier protein] synthase